MAIDISSFEDSIRRKKGLMDKLGDTGRFLKALFRGSELSEAAVKKTIDELEQYSATCFDQIEDMGQDWQKTFRQIAELKQRMTDALPPIKSTLIAQAGVLLRRYEGFKGRIDKLKRNGIAAQVLIEKLYDVLILKTGPMTEDSIDEWVTTLDEAIEDRAMADKALQELDSTHEEQRLNRSEMSMEEIESQVDRITSKKRKSNEERDIEKRLEEF
jgi:hypothetical protein